jgi:Flp pilus assembly pilin Flp
VTKRMLRVIATFFRREEGQDLAEYAIALGVVAVFVAALAIAIGENVNTLWATAQTSIETVINGE